MEQNQTPKQYNDFEDDETNLAPCKDRVWHLFGNIRATADLKQQQYAKRNYQRHKDYYRQYYINRKNKNG